MNSLIIPVRPRIIRGAVLAAAMLTILPFALRAQESDTLPSTQRADSSAGIQGEVRVNGMHFGNFYQAPDSADRRNVRALAVDGRVEWPLVRSGNTRLYGAGNLVVYDDPDPSTRIAGGVHTRRGTRVADLSAGFRSNAPRFDVGDRFEQADILDVAAVLATRPTDDIEVGLLGLFAREWYTIDDQKNSTVSEVGAAVRYRGFGYLFSPEVGAAFGKRSVELEVEDYAQREVFLQIRSVPTPPLYLSARYRNRLRDYGTDLETASNFGREDTRHQLTLAGELRLSTALSWSAYYAWETSDSSLDSRDFTVQLLSTGLVYRFR